MRAADNKYPEGNVGVEWEISASYSRATKLFIEEIIDKTTIVLKMSRAKVTAV